MENPRPEKVAVVEEVRGKFSSADAAILTEYRGIDVPAMQRLRRAVTEAGGDYRVYKNTLVRRAVADLDFDIEDLLLGPTAIAFIPPGDDGPGDPVPVARAMWEFSRTNENLVVKGGLLGDVRLSADEARALATVQPRPELLARFAGGLAAPLQSFAGLLAAMPRELAGLLRALIDEQGGPEAAEAEAAQREAAQREAAEAEAAQREAAEAEAAEREAAQREAAEAEAAESEPGGDGNEGEAAAEAEAAESEAGEDGNDNESDNGNEKEADPSVEAAKDTLQDNGNEKESEAG